MAAAAHMPQPSPSSGSRPTCPRCARPLRTCLCPWVVPTANRVPVLILQHPLETHHAKGSATLLRLSLAHCEVWVGERFDEPRLQQALGAWGSACLLYPATEPVTPPADDVTATAADPTVLGTASGLHRGEPTPGCLLVLDATWRKSRKLLHLNPWLARLPRLSLPDPPPSRYRIRKAQQPHQRSTLEATALALQWIEGDEARYQPLLKAFEGFVAEREELGAKAVKAGPPETICIVFSNPGMSLKHA
ncbi:MAG: tRNA-uridine aminocarboxypropyltransferase [Ideonella sp.]|nr:tRNA-uridine aminocarboxypropyltransferase [Ideonella sp.]